MEKTWRWFGKNDLIKLEMLKQIGVEGIVTALHEIPNGEIWSKEQILDTKRYIESKGLKWSVVESLPVSEQIKLGSKERDFIIENYIKSLENLGEAGIKTVCYNFMPVLDWARTDLLFKLFDGSYTLYFDKAKFAYFDIHILKRSNAELDYSIKELKAVENLANSISNNEIEKLIDTIIVKTQGFINGNISSNDLAPLNKFKDLLSKYENIDKEQLRANLKYFLNKIIPTCEKYEISMCIHPDDPPFSLFGLPRIVSNEEDISWVLDAVDNKYNGLTFCSGSLSASVNNDVIHLAKKFAHRTKFLHLRSTEILNDGDFIEADHLKGRGKVIDLIKIFQSMNPNLPMRPDHGKVILGDENINYNPGYSFHGRMLAFAHLHGVIETIKHTQKII
ncbi:mannonate dehydratase [Sphingobacterium sp. UBA5670]|uniref:mannonate dehydratase n=1 Tax=Sphingobacterium sp. UBA5670 TaxID=1947502 RepID=UPI0025EC282B|nr:mannonate dehydratase [Sphingobacterium sp. UBA5670]